MKIGIQLSVVAVVLLAVAMLFNVGWERPPMQVTQKGYRGVGMEQVTNPRLAAKDAKKNQVPEAQPPAAKGGPRATSEYKNVKVLTDLNVEEFNRVMLSITEWVSPEQGCNYCHNPENLADDNVYTKIVSRRMLEMTRDINAKWKTHVGDTGVTCYTCHRGKNVPDYIWYTDPAPSMARGIIGERAGQNAPSKAVGLTSLPNDPYSLYLGSPSEIRVISKTALPAGNRSSIKQTEGTYGLMMHMSDSLGVNCTYCHNTRSFADWDQSSPARATSWHAIRMMRDLNQAYLEPLKPAYPAKRLGVLGDAPKANCGTCHQGASKPLYGAKMLKDHPELAGARTP